MAGKHKEEKCIIKPWRGVNAFRIRHTEMGTISVPVCSIPEGNYTNKVEMSNATLKWDRRRAKFLFLLVISKPIIEDFSAKEFQHRFLTFVQSGSEIKSN